MASVKFVAVSGGVAHIINYVTDKEKTTDSLITGVNCMAQSAVHEFAAVKKLYHKTDGRAYYHIVQAFSPTDPIDFQTAHEIGLKFAQRFDGFQCVVATHMNTAHIHNHIIMNSVNFETGKMFHQSAAEMRAVKEFSNELCMQYGLSVTETKADPFAIPRWKQQLRETIKDAMANSDTPEQFVAYMKDYGYGVDWQPGRKNITYTTPNQMKCRDNKLFDDTLTRANMELYFAMGGAEYYEARREATEDGDPWPTMDDVVCRLHSAADAMMRGNEQRFRSEMQRHSTREVSRMLSTGRRIATGMSSIFSDDDPDTRQIKEMIGFAEIAALIISFLAECYEKYKNDLLDDSERIAEEIGSEQDEYEQHHGFSMGGMGMW